MARRKMRVMTMLVTVRVPDADEYGRPLNGAAARREVRNLIMHGTGWSTDPGDIRVVSVKPIPKGAKR